MTDLSFQDMDELIGFGKPASIAADWIIDTYMPGAPVSYRLSIEHVIAKAIVEDRKIGVPTTQLHTYSVQTAGIAEVDAPLDNDLYDPRVDIIAKLMIEPLLGETVGISQRIIARDALEKILSLSITNKEMQ